MYKIVPSRESPNSAFVVRAIDSERDGELYIAVFEGSDAKQRAEEYARWKNGQ
jgi:hypothetical protein